MTDWISMVLIDDDALAREGALALLRGRPGFVVLATAANATEALQLVRARRPDVVLVNLRRAGMDRFVLAGALHGEAPASRTIIMGIEAGTGGLSHLIRAGVSGFVMTHATLETVLATVGSVARGEDVLPPELTAPLFAELNRRSPEPVPDASSVGEQLSGRERDVRDLMVLGLSDDAIAARLDCTAPTARRHVRRVLAKSSADGALEVAALSQGSSRRPTAPPTSPSDEGPARFLTLSGLFDHLSTRMVPA